MAEAKTKPSHTSAYKHTGFNSEMKLEAAEFFSSFYFWKEMLLHGDFVYW